MNYSNSFDVLQEDDESSIPVEKQLRNKNKKLREIERLKSKPCDQLNEAQRAKIELEKHIRDEIEYIEESMKEQSKSQTSYHHRPVQKKRKKKKNAPKSKKKNKMTKKQREVYEKHREKVKENVNDQAQQQKKRKRNWNETRRRHQEEQERLRQQEEQERLRRQAQQERLRLEKEQEKLKKLVKPYFPNIPVQKIINIAMKFALRSKQDMSIEDALNKIADAGRMFTIKDILNLDKRDIIRKYRKLSLKHHPDKGGSDKMMQNVNNANDILNELISYN